MKRLMIFVVVVLLGLLAGVSGATAFLAGVADFGSVSSGPWRTHPAIGAAAADPLTRARVARLGLLALNRDEAVYFTAATDSDGARLTDQCDYALVGGDLPARWWSVTLYAEDDFLAMNGDEAHAISADSTARDADGGFTALVSRARPADAANWISSKNADAFTLTARLYNPDDGVADDLAAVALPRIERRGCAGEAP